MSQVPCEACQTLREDAPDFYANGVTTAVCNSLRNNTGLDRTNGNDNYTDLTTALNCLIGNMSSMLKSFGVCDWQDYLAKYIPNEYEVLKAILCNERGQWENIDELQAFIDSICPSIDNIFNLMRSARPPHHDGYFLESFIEKLHGNYSGDGNTRWGDNTPTVDNFKPSFRCDILEGGGCTANKRLGRYHMGWHRDPTHYPYVWGWGPDEAITVGDVIGVVPRTAIPDEDMSLDKWKDILHSNKMVVWGLMGSSLVHVTYSGYVIIDGVAMNTQYSSYGENNLVLRWGPIVGASTTGGINTSLASATESYDA